MKNFIAIDIGGSNIRVAVSESVSNPVLKNQISITNNHDYDAYLSEIIKYISQYKNIYGIGISVTGDVDDAGLMVVDSSPNAPEILFKPIVAQLKENFSCPVFMDNDGTVSALGEALYGQNKKLDILYIIWGTGIGGATINFERNTIQIHQIDWQIFFKEWEFEIGGKSLVEKYEDVERITKDDWDQIIDTFYKNLLRLIDNFNFKKVALGGGVAINNPEVVKKIDKRFSNVSVAVTNFGDDTGLLGAFGLLSKHDKLVVSRPDKRK